MEHVKDPLLPRSDFLNQLFGEKNKPHPVTVNRWLKNPKSGFPQPDATINGRDYWRLSTADRLKGGQDGRT